MNKKNTAILDMLGMCTSMVCAIHCLCIPLFLIFGFESILRIIDQEWIEGLIIGLSLVIGLVAFGGGYLRHKQHFIPVLFIAGFLLIVNGELVSNEWISLGLSISGAMVLIYTHVQNLKWKRYAYTH
ncbi:MerC domain-containing protein [Ekhidna sp.]